MKKLLLITFTLYWLTAYTVANAAEATIDVSKWNRYSWTTVYDKVVYKCTSIRSPDELQAYVKCKIKGKRL